MDSKYLNVHSKKDVSTTLDSRSDAHDDNYNDNIDDDGVVLQGNCCNCYGSMRGAPTIEFGISNMTQSIR